MLTAVLLSATLLVPDDHATIQAALLAAQPGDEILVRPGVYFERLDYLGKAVTVRSEQGPVVTIIDAGGLGSCARFDSGEGAGSVIEGFTLRNGAGTDLAGSPVGGGVYCLDSSPVIRGNIITSCTAWDGAGVGCVGSSSPAILENEIRGNTSEYTGAGIALWLNNTAAVVTDNLIQANSALSDHGGGVFVSNGSVDLLRNSILDNSSSQSGGGVFLLGSAGVPPLVQDNLIAGNSAVDDGGGVWCSGTNPSFERNALIGNAAPYGAGMYLRGQSLGVHDNTFAANAATIAGGGLYLDGSNTFTGWNNILRGNSAPSAPNLEANGEPVTFEYCDIGGGWPGTGNIDAPPMYQDADGADNDPLTWIDNDYRIRASSPCRDAGNPASAPGADGTPADIGALDFDLCGPITYCVSSPNAAGAGAYIGWSGSTSLSAADLVLTASGVPPGTFGLFFYGTTQVQVPLGGGVRCVGGSIFRIGPASLAGPDGVNSRALEFNAPPLGAGPGAVSAGQTWNFQYWFREPAGSAAPTNLSNALQVPFCP